MPIAHPLPPAARVTGIIPCTRLGAMLSILVALIYFGFLLTGAFAPGLLSQPVIGHIPWSFALGAGMLLTALGSTGAYVVLSDAAERAGDAA